MANYSLVITSSGRHDLLHRTLMSFLACADGGPQETLVIEDGPSAAPEWFPRHRARWISNGAQRGQVFSIDKVYDQVQTEYVMHLEDDWQFCEGGFVQRSLDILQANADVIQVSLRNDAPPVSHLNKAWQEVAGGFSWNPGMRRMSDYRRIGNYGRHVGYDPADYSAELKIAKLYKSLGYRGESLPAHCYHIGEERHCNRKDAPNVPKILIAVPTAETLDYSLFREAQLKKWGDRARGWVNGVSGLQIDGTNARKAAVADTWFKDAAAFNNVTARFFTGPELDVPDDHVHLPLKMRAICQWMVKENFDLMFRADDDTFVNVARLVRQGAELTEDYAGVEQGGFFVTGPGAWFTRKSCEILANADVPDWHTEWRDDFWAGDVLRRHGIKPGNDLPGLQIVGCEGVPAPMTTLHPVGPEEMRKLYADSGCLSHQ
jgi:hypothetical protein